MTTENRNRAGKLVGWEAVCVTCKERVSFRKVGSAYGLRDAASTRPTNPQCAECFEAMTKAYYAAKSEGTR